MEAERTEVSVRGKRECLVRMLGRDVNYNFNPMNVEERPIFCKFAQNFTSVTQNN